MGFFKSLMSVISTDGKTGAPFKLNKNHSVYYKGNRVEESEAAHVKAELGEVLLGTKKEESMMKRLRFRNRWAFRRKIFFRLFIFMIR